MLILKIPTIVNNGCKKSKKKNPVLLIIGRKFLSQEKNLFKDVTEICLEKKSPFSEDSLSSRTITRRIAGNRYDLLSSLKKKASSLTQYSLGLDESIEVSDTS